jgi:CheY-like chemotaxis protein
MDRAKIIAGYLPSLRRYSRAITGSQQAGDAAVLAALQILVASKSAAVEDRQIRIELHKALLQIINGPAGERLQMISPFSSPDRQADTALSAMSSLPRQSFLLTAMEGFSVQDAAEIMETSIAELNGYLSLAQQEIATQVATDVLIIEDEVFIAKDLERIVQGLGHRVLYQARTRKEAVRAAKGSKQPGLVLADIHLADGSSGIDAANDILDCYQVPLVFITAYPERLLTGLRPEPTFLISKPFTVHQVRGVISQVLFFKSASRPVRPNAAPAPIISSASMLRAG